MVYYPAPYSLASLVCFVLLDGVFFVFFFLFNFTSYLRDLTVFRNPYCTFYLLIYLLLEH